jgi:hypothetical protein
MKMQLVLMFGLATYLFWATTLAAVLTGLINPGA